MGGRRWTEQERRRLRLLVEDVPLSAIAQKLGRSPCAVQSKIDELHLSVRLAARSEGMSRADVEAALGVSKGAVMNWIRSGQLRMVQRRRFRERYYTVAHEEVIRFLEDGGALYGYLRPDADWKEEVERARALLLTRYISTHEICERCCITAPAINIRRRYGFPAPVLNLGGAWYDRPAVEAWFRAHPQRCRMEL